MSLNIEQKEYKVNPSEPLPACNVPVIERREGQSTTDLYWTLRDQGFAPLPISPVGKFPARYAGPASKNPYPALGNWTRFQVDPVTDGILASWGRMNAVAPQNFGIGVVHSETFVAVDVDVDDAVLWKRLRDCLPADGGEFVERRGKKGSAIYFRCEAGQFQSKNITLANGAGGVDILAAGRQSVLPPSIHPETQKPYVWLSEATLYEVEPRHLPLLTPENFAPFLSILEEVGIREDNDFSGGGSIDREFDPTNLNSVALANLEAWVPLLPLCRVKKSGGRYAAVPHWRSSTTGRSLEKRSRNLSIHPGGIRDFGDDRLYTPTRLVETVLGYDWRHAQDWLADKLSWSPPKMEPYAPKSKRDQREKPRQKGETTIGCERDRVEAREKRLDRPQLQELREGITEAQKAVRKAYTGEAYAEATDTLYDLEYRLAKAEKDVKVHVIPAVTGVGKNRYVKSHFLNSDLDVAYALPNQDLAREQALDMFKYHGVKIHQLRGMAQPSILDEDLSLSKDELEVTRLQCENPVALKGVRYGAPLARFCNLCPFAGKCGKQTEADLSKTTLPHADLFRPPPEELNHDLLVIDETLYKSALVINKIQIEVDEIATGLSFCSDGFEEDDVDRYELADTCLRKIGGALLKSKADGKTGLMRLHAKAEGEFWLKGIQDAEVRCAISVLTTLKYSTTECLDGLTDAEEYEAWRERDGRLLQKYSALLELVLAVQKFMESRVAVSGRIRIDENGLVRLNDFEPVHPEFIQDRPVVLTNATPEPQWMLDSMFAVEGRTPWLKYLDSKRVPFADDVVVEQCYKHPFSASRLHLSDVRKAFNAVDAGGEYTEPGRGKKQRQDLKRFIEGRAATSESLLVFAHSSAVRWLRHQWGDDMPPNLEFRSFGKPTGTNSFSRFTDCLIIDHDELEKSVLADEVSAVCGELVEDTSSSKKVVFAKTSERWSGGIPNWGAYQFDHPRMREVFEYRSNSMIEQGMQRLRLHLSPWDLGVKEPEKHRRRVTILSRHPLPFEIDDFYAFSKIREGWKAADKRGDVYEIIEDKGFTRNLQVMEALYPEKSYTEQSLNTISKGVLPTVDFRYSIDSSITESNRGQHPLQSTRFHIDGRGSISEFYSTHETNAEAIDFLRKETGLDIQLPEGELSDLINESVFPVGIKALQSKLGISTQKARTLSGKLKAYLDQPDCPHELVDARETKKGGQRLKLGVRRGINMLEGYEVVSDGTL